LKFKIQNFQATLNVDMIYAKVLVVNAIYNFTVDNFLKPQISIQNSRTLIFKLFEYSNSLNFQTISDRHTPFIRIVELIMT
jgi:hypothetical protein